MENIDYLCNKYDIAVFKIGDSCFRDTSPAAVQDKWFISTLANETRFNINVEAPYCNSEQEAKKLAVKIYGLENLYKKKLKP